jgi:hypothetical protein
MISLRRWLCALSGHRLTGPVVERSWETGGWIVRRYCATCGRLVRLHYPDGSGG